MIQFTHVFKTYPSQITALSDISLEILGGEFIFITGPSGSGKTTLLRLLYGAERPTSGEITVNGIRLTPMGFSKMYRLRRLMGIVSREFKLLQDRTVRGNVSFALEVTGHAGLEAKTRVSEILTRLKLQEREEDSIVTLSAGEQQRVAIARALVNDPPFLLADEPTENLDAPATIEIMEIFEDLHLKGTSVVFATRDADLIQRYPYPVIHLLSGKRVDDKMSDQVRKEA
jgi:cell division transport system ATP-binding protein